MNIPKYLEDRFSKTLPDAKVWRAGRHYAARLAQKGLCPGMALWDYFVEEQFAFCPCEWQVILDLTSSCAITFVFSRPTIPYCHDLQTLAKVRVRFEGVQDIHCVLNACGSKCDSRYYMHSSLWWAGKKAYIAITLTSGVNDDSTIAFSYSSVSIFPL